MSALGSLRKKIVRNQVLADARSRLQDAKKNDPKFGMLDRSTKRSLFDGMVKRMVREKLQP